jgi:hypothetical protein
MKKNSFANFNRSYPGPDGAAGGGDHLGGTGYGTP